MTKNSAVTLLSCDNVRENGEKFEKGLREFLSLCRKDDVLAFMDQYVTCPNTMVDRITPHPSSDLPEHIKVVTGIDDKLSKFCLISKKGLRSDISFNARFNSTADNCKSFKDRCSLKVKT